MPKDPFRILALSGGGVRGIFQASYVRKLASSLAPTPLKDHFELIAGTSTGAMISVALALGIDPNRIVDFYKRDSQYVFTSRLATRFSKGPRYSAEYLRTFLSDLFPNKRLGDCRPAVLVTAATLDRFRYRLFSSVDEHDAQ